MLDWNKNLLINLKQNVLTRFLLKKQETSSTVHIFTVSLSPHDFAGKRFCIDASLKGNLLSLHDGMM
jgi:hypothetical protein